MKRLPLLLAMCGLLALPALRAGDAPAGEADFPRGTLAGLLARHAELFKKSDAMFDREVDRLGVIVVWSGAVRAIPPEHEKFLARWAQAFGTRAFVDQYREEIRVSEGKRLFWIPCQSRLLDFLRKEQGPGALLGVRLRFLGARQHGSDPIFMLVGYTPLDPKTGKPLAEPGSPAPAPAASAPAEPPQ